MEPIVRDLPNRPPLWIGILLLLGGFAGLCTIFSILVTAAIAWQEHRESLWPQITANVQQCSLNKVGSRSRSYGIECRISYVVNGKTIGSYVRSMSSPDPDAIIWEPHTGKALETYNQMQDWVDAHTAGTPIAVHYNPFNPTKAALVATDMPLGGPQTQRNISLTEFVATICVVLLGIGIIARHVSLR